MFTPERIDHHGWQLALLALSVAGIADPERVRGGLMLGISSALSLAIGLEMIIYLALAGGAIVLFWVDEPEERRAAARLCGLARRRHRARASWSSPPTTIGTPVCDALSPVWLSDALLGGALDVRASPGCRRATGSGGSRWRSPPGVVIAAFHALSWPHCLHRLEGVSPEVDRLWLSHVKEARPVYMHGWRIAALISALPIVGAIGWALLAWRHRQ